MSDGKESENEESTNEGSSKFRLSSLAFMFVMSNLGIMIAAAKGDWFNIFGVVGSLTLGYVIVSQWHALRDLRKEFKIKEVDLQKIVVDLAMEKTTVRVLTQQRDDAIEHERALQTKVHDLEAANAVLKEEKSEAEGESARLKGRNDRLTESEKRDRKALLTFLSFVLKQMQIIRSAKAKDMDGTWASELRQRLAHEVMRLATTQELEPDFFATKDRAELVFDVMTEMAEALHSRNRLRFGSIFRRQHESELWDLGIPRILLVSHMTRIDKGNDQDVATQHLLDGNGAIRPMYFRAAHDLAREIRESKTMEILSVTESAGFLWLTGLFEKKSN
ncbi:hypothetical protein HON52_02225 [Candidatus Uhrbacteria bacterium]|jgi:hypothetical protein|nr:hypothetical protein [Candidatus Uhrbacteria bacterium]